MRGAWARAVSSSKIARWTTDQPGPATYLLTDGLGRVVARQEVLLRASATTQLPIELSNCAPGLYVLRVQQGQQYQMLKVVR